jgi:hypothetical protein
MKMSICIFNFRQKPDSKEVIESVEDSYDNYEFDDQPDSLQNVKKEDRSANKPKVEQFPEMTHKLAQEALQLLAGKMKEKDLIVTELFEKEATLKKSFDEQGKEVELLYVTFKDVHNKIDYLGIQLTYEQSKALIETLSNFKIQGAVLVRDLIGILMKFGIPKERKVPTPKSDDKKADLEKEQRVNESKQQSRHSSKNESVDNKIENSKNQEIDKEEEQPTQVKQNKIEEETKDNASDIKSEEVEKAVDSTPKKAQKEDEKEENKHVSKVETEKREDVKKIDESPIKEEASKIQEIQNEDDLKQNEEELMKKELMKEDIKKEENFPSKSSPPK